MKGGSETYYFALGKMLSNAGHKLIYFSMRDDNNPVSRISILLIMWTTTQK